MREGSRSWEKVYSHAHLQVARSKLKRESVLAWACPLSARVYQTDGSFVLNKSFTLTTRSQHRAVIGVARAESGNLRGLKARRDAD
eukprot:1568818-Rhodomonas_salina.3